MKTDINDALLGIYKKYWKSLQKALSVRDTIAEKISYPWLIHSFPGYQQAIIKVFIVGQEPGGWGFSKQQAHYWGTSEWDNDADLLIQRVLGIYKDFNLGEKYYSPFWTASRKLYRLINPGCPEDGFMQSNLIVIDQNKKRPDTKLEDSVCAAFPVLPLEINIAKPSVLIFFTGPRYDGRLLKTFSGAEYEGISGYKIRTLARVIHDKLPYNCYRTYHPNYIYQSKQTQILNDISAMVKGHI